jgi:hypothetical protein
MPGLDPGFVNDCFTSKTRSLGLIPASRPVSFSLRRETAHVMGTDKTREKPMKAMTLAAAGMLCAAGVASAQTPITNNPISTFDAANLGFTPAAIDLSGQPIAATLSGGNNTLVSNFSTAVYSGTLTSEVFANTGSVGPSVTDVVIKYTFDVDSGSFQGIQDFRFGVNSTIDLDSTDLINSIHGRVLDESTVAQTTPDVFVDTTGTNTVFGFNFNSPGGPGDALEAGESFTWYVQTDGNVTVNLVDVAVTDGFNTNAQALSFVSGTQQDDLNVPTPGSAALLALGGLVAARRRRG